MFDGLPMFDGLRLRHWRAERRPDAMLLLTLDRADQGVNALSREVLDELDQLVERIAIEKPRAVVICSGKKAGFIPGADIKGFEELDRKDQVHDWIRLGQLVFQRLAELPCPTRYTTPLMTPAATSPRAASSRRTPT